MHELTIQEATEQLEAQGMPPVWTWPQFTSSVGGNLTGWMRGHTLRPEPWDHDDMHHNVFNLLRFYLPYLDPFRNRSTLFFADDDIVVQKDIGLLDVHMGPEQVVAATCNGWQWSDEGKGKGKNVQVKQTTSWRRTSAPGNLLYLNKDSPKTWKPCDKTPRRHKPDLPCQNTAYEKRMQDALQKALGRRIDFEEQKVWNFGFARFNMTEWRAQELTGVYESLLRDNYAQHLWPETSLAFGLGLAYLTFADRVACWEDLVNASFLDGLGYVSYEDIQASKVDLNESIVLHWSGREKPWKMDSKLDEGMREPFRRMYEDELQLGRIEDNRPGGEGVVFRGSDDLNAWGADQLRRHENVLNVNEHEG